MPIKGLDLSAYEPEQLSHEALPTLPESEVHVNAGFR